MTIPPLSFDTAIPLPSGVADGLLRRRTRSVLSVNPPTDVPDAFVARALAALARDAGGDDKARAVTEALAQEGLTEAVARYLFKLMAYKDEYEVARLHSDRRFLDKVAAQFEGKMGEDFQLAYHLAPPAIAKRNEKGELQKRRFGPWMLSAFRMLAKLKGLRGTAFDPFGRTEERRTERALIVEYRSAIEEVLRTLGPANLALAIEIARVPEMIRGYGHVKQRHLDTARPKWDALMADWRAGPLRIGAQPGASRIAPIEALDAQDTQPLRQAFDSRIEP